MEKKSDSLMKLTGQASQYWADVKKTGEPDFKHRLRLGTI